MQKFLWGRWAQCEDCPFECGKDEPVGLREDNEALIYEHIFECGAGENCDTDLICNRC